MANTKTFASNPEQLFKDRMDRESAEIKMLQPLNKEQIAGISALSTTAKNAKSGNAYPITGPGGEIWWITSIGGKQYGFKDQPKNADGSLVSERLLFPIVADQNGRLSTTGMPVKMNKPTTDANTGDYQYQIDNTGGGDMGIITIPKKTVESTKKGTGTSSGKSKEPEYKSLDFAQPDLLPQSEIDYARALIAGQNKETGFNFGRGALNAFAEGAAETGSKKIMDAIDYNDWQGRQIPELERLYGTRFRTKSDETKQKGQSEYIDLQKKRKNIEDAQATAESPNGNMGPGIDPNIDYQAQLDEVDKMLAEKEKWASTAGADDTSFSQFGTTPSLRAKQGIIDQLASIMAFLPYEQQKKIDELKGRMQLDQMKAGSQLSNDLIKIKYTLEERKRQGFGPDNNGDIASQVITLLGGGQPPTTATAPTATK